MPVEIPDQPPETLPLGQDAILVRFARTPSYEAAAACQAFHQMLQQKELPHVVEIVPSLISVLIRFDRAQTTRAALLTVLNPLLDAENWLQTALPAPHRRWDIPVAFGGAHGPQLEEFAALAGLSPEACIQEAGAADLRVLAIGFAPGQPYLGYLPDHWNVPRQRELTPLVPGGAIVTAVQQMVLFTSASTTGWRQIGQTGFRPFLMERATPFLLKQGDALRLCPVSHDSYADLLRSNTDGLGGARCEVLT